ncbi:MAG: glycerophosphodiester phosphodiesterase [Isosphaeraceae bacterium]|nr:glycerophosphodiester phosphodiesterase [Isosphaeraceae bacterium]
MAGLPGTAGATTVLDAWKGRGTTALPWVIAHRGDSAHAPENTLEAARRAWKAGADAWELDVQLTRDGVPIVLHDETLRRTTDVAQRFAGDPRGAAGFRVADFDLDEIRILDAGSWFLDPRGGPRTAVDFGTLDCLGTEERVLYASGAVRVPTLAEALGLTEQLDWRVNVELKSFPDATPRLVDAVLDLIDRLGVARRVWISSFDHSSVARVARRGHGVATGVLTAHPLHRPQDYVQGLIGADAYHPSAQILGAGSAAYRRRPSPAALLRRDLEALAGARIPVFVYTVNDVAEGGLADHLAQVGVAGLFTDDPGPLITRWG